MRVFVSWSGRGSREVAEALKQWLPSVIQAAEVFYSPDDIGKGTEWFHELGGELQKSSFGIICLTPMNLAAPWILYEAGAIARALDARVVPLRIGLEQDRLHGPLAELNAASLEKDDVFRVVKAINAELGAHALEEKRLTDAFAHWWPSLEEKLAAAVLATKPSAQFEYDVFLSTPMAAFASDDDYRRVRGEFKKVFDALTVDAGRRVYWASEKIESIADFDALDVSATADLAALDTSHHFALLYPERLASSALFEAGYAAALKRSSHYFVRDRADLPFLMRELAGPVTSIRIHTSLDWASWDDLARKVRKSADTWFPR